MEQTKNKPQLNVLAYQEGETMPEFDFRVSLKSNIFVHLDPMPLPKIYIQLLGMLGDKFVNSS